MMSYNVQMWQYGKEQVKRKQAAETSFFRSLEFGKRVKPAGELGYFLLRADNEMQDLLQGALGTLRTPFL